MIARHTSVSIPVHIGTERGAAPQLDESHTSFDEPSGHQASSGEVAALLLVRSVHRQSVSCFFREIGGLRNCQLHTRRQFVASKSTFQRIFTHPIVQMTAIDFR